MFTDGGNKGLYALDGIASQATGGVNVIGASRVIEVSPVGRSQYPATFTRSLDLVWHGAVVTFNNEPIYPTAGNTGLWVVVERPPVVAVS